MPAPIDTKYQGGFEYAIYLDQGIPRHPDPGLKGRRPNDLVIAGKADQVAGYVERVIADDRTS